MKLDRPFLKQLSINECLSWSFPWFHLLLWSINVCHEFFHFMNFSNGRSRISIDPPGSNFSLSLYIQYITNMFNVICIYIKWFDTLKHIYTYIKHIYAYIRHIYIYIHIFYVCIYICIHTCFSLRIEYGGSVSPLVLKKAFASLHPNSPNHQTSHIQKPPILFCLREMLSVWVLDLLISPPFLKFLCTNYFYIQPSSNHHLTSYI